MMDSYPLDEMLGRIEEAVRPYPKAALFELRDLGYTTTFQQLIACVISIRTLDEVTLPVSLRLFQEAPSPSDFLRMSPLRLATLLRPATFAETKAERMLQIARIAQEQHGGALPADPDLLQGLPGVGPKCANLAAGVSGGRAGISVDTHVHRIVNRWGLVLESSPERTMDRLERVVPEQYWLDLNRLLVPFGKHVCTPRRPKCSICPVLTWCKQVGVTDHR